MSLNSEPSHACPRRNEVRSTGVDVKVDVTDPQWERGIETGENHDSLKDSQPTRIPYLE